MENKTAVGVLLHSPPDTVARAVHHSLDATGQLLILDVVLGKQHLQVVELAAACHDHMAVK
jgi:hypothetical protein